MSDNTGLRSPVFLSWASGAVVKINGLAISNPLPLNFGAFLDHDLLSDERI